MKCEWIRAAENRQSAASIDGWLVFAWPVLSRPRAGGHTEIASPGFGLFQEHELLRYASCNSRRALGLEIRAIAHRKKHFTERKGVTAEDEHFPQFETANDVCKDAPLAKRGAFGTARPWNVECDHVWSSFPIEQGAHPLRSQSKKQNRYHRRKAELGAAREPTGRSPANDAFTPLRSRSSGFQIEKFCHHSHAAP